MDTTQRIDRFIAERREERAGGREIERLMPGTVPFVTISSESGAGGHRLAEALLALLEAEPDAPDTLRGWRLFDKSMCAALLEREHLAEAMGELLDEDYHSQVAEFVGGIFGAGGMQGAAQVRLSRQLRTLASVGRVVILGHGGFMAARGLEGGTHVRLVAPPALRGARMASVLGVDERQAERLIRERDTAQQKLWKAHYRVDSTDPACYDLVFNTERLSPQTVAEMVLSLLKKRVR